MTETIVSIFDGSAVRQQERPQFVTQIDVARMLNVSDRTVRNWDAKGKLKGHRPAGGVKLYPIADVVALATGK